MPPAPPTFSMITVWRRTSERRAPRIRPMTSVGPPAAYAGKPARVRGIGIVVEGMRSPAYDGFLQGMDELGYVAGRDYLIEWRFADGRYLRILELVENFAKLNIDAIFLGSPAMIYPV